MSNVKPKIETKAIATKMESCIYDFCNSSKILDIIQNTL
jgi:hypothetical protein